MNVNIRMCRRLTRSFRIALLDTNEKERIKIRGCNPHHKNHLLFQFATLVIFRADFPVKVQQLL
jgi:hypothetical protein